MYNYTQQLQHVAGAKHTPVYGVAGVLQEVGALLLSQTVLSPPRRGGRWLCARARGHGSQWVDDTRPAGAREAWSQVLGSDSDSSANLLIRRHEKLASRITAIIISSQTSVAYSSPL